MRILHIFDHSLPLQSGYVSRSLGILRNQHERGWETIHVTSARHSAWADHASAVETVEGLTIHRTPSPGVHLPILREITEMRALRRRLVTLIRSERPDVIHAHSPVLNALPAISVGRQFGLPVVYEVRALWEDAAVENGHLHMGSPRYYMARWLDTWAMRRADAIVPICEPLCDEIAKRGIAADRLTVVPNAVDALFLAEPPAPDEQLRDSLGLKDRFVLGFIGSFYRYEGLDLLLEAVAILRREISNVTVLLVGGGPEEDQLRSRVTALGLDAHVRFAGRVKPDEVIRYYRLVDLFVFPRRRVRLTDLVTPLKPLEAMAQSKPVIASDVGGHRELLQHGETGYLSPPDDASALAACLRTIIINPADRARVAENGRRFVEKNRSWSAIITRYAAIYEALLARKRMPLASGSQRSF